MGEYITGTTNQGGTIGSSTLPIKDFRVDTLTADTINYTTLNPSINVSIDDVTIIKNSDGELEVNPDFNAASATYAEYLNIPSSQSVFYFRQNGSEQITIDTAGTYSAGNNSLFLGSSPITFYINGATALNLDGSGDLTINGWLYVKGKNRLYQQNLTAATTTSTTATLLGTALSITPAFSGYIVINAILRVNNNTVGDGVTVSLLNGTTVLDTETYVQEGLASNSHTIFLHYELSGQTIGTALSLSLNFNAVTGGTASAKIVAFDAKEI